MTVFDYALLGILGLSVLVSVWRGAVRELLALASWVIAFLVAQAYAGTVGALMPAAIPSPALRVLAGFLVVFLTVLLLVAITSLAISQLVRAAGLGPLDRTLGAIFGLLRGILVAALLVLLAGLTSAPRESWWRNAMFSAPMEALVLAVKPWLPDELAGRISYD